MIRNPPQFNALLAHVRQFVRAECMPLEQEVDRSDEIPEALVQRMREMGLFGHSIPEAYGGAGLTSEELSLVNIEVSQVATSFRARFGGNTGIASESQSVETASVDDIAIAIIAANAELSAAIQRSSALEKLHRLAREAGAVGTDRAVDAALKREGR